MGRISAAASRRQKAPRVAIKPALLVLLFSQLLASSFIATQASSASYLDDYFSTAKYALNRIQQSLIASSDSVGQQQTGSQASANKSSSASQANTLATTSTTSTPEASTKIAAPPPEAEPDRSEFIKVVDTTEKDSETSGSGTSTGASAASEDVGSTQQRQEETRQRVNDDDTTTIVATSGSQDQQPAEATPTTIDPTSVAQAIGQRSPDDGPSLLVVQSEPASSNDIRPSEEVIRETEVNAVAAVEQSIGFGNELNLFQNDREPCYDEYGNPRFCEPEFENLAYERPVSVSSECGQPASRFCTVSASGLAGGESQIRNCHICDGQHPKKRHPASYLTDSNSANNPTCWVSAPIQVTNNYLGAHPTNSIDVDIDSSSNSNNSNNNNNNINNTSLSEEQQTIRGDNVTLVLDLDKTYEILYVSLQFCSPRPDSLSIEKSKDFGRSWQPYQFYSSHCARLYGRQQQSAATTTAKSAQEPMAGCANVSSSGSSATRVAFSTLDSRSGASLDRSPALQDWVSATNIRITLDRHQAAWIQSTLGLHSARSHSPAGDQATAPAQKSSFALASSATTIGSSSSSNNNATPTADIIMAASGQQQPQPESSQQLTNPSRDTFNYAISDLTIGGRCKCNGHASRCVHGKDGRLQCECRHNTAGRDCERCAPLHADRPWARATPTEANICQACNCNGHSRKCKFDEELYRLSGKRSGGVCLQCKDNTDGRYCHYCKEGFTRDHSKPMSDKEACKVCDCHPIGSLGRVCNQTTGQCPCKEGVAGLQCNRCAPGYQQSSSLSEPCLRIPPPETSNEINNELAVTETDDDQPTINQVPNDGDSQPTISQDQAAAVPALAQAPPPPSPALPLPPTITSRAPPGGPDQRWADEEQNHWRDQAPSNKLYPMVEPDDDRSLDYSRGSNMYWGSRKPGPPKPYHGYPITQRFPMHRPKLEPTDEEPDDLSMDEMRGADNRDTIYGPPSGGYAPNYPPLRQPHPGRYRQYHYRQPIQPVANLNQDDDSDQEGFVVNPYAHNIYSDDSNQIPAAHRRLSQHYQQQQQQLARGQNQAQAQTQTRRPATTSSSATPNGSNSNNNNNVHQNVNSLAIKCGGECRMRRLKSAKFCELEFAIRCSILNTIMAEDWTKLEVEIQDIFKSPMGAPSAEPTRAALQHSQASSSSRSLIQPVNYLDMMQQDAPVVVGPNSNSNSNESANNKTVADNDIVPQLHRLKVGTVQTVWVPTEDLVCKCLRLKRDSTYLMMGTIDAKENSVNALQLDRHGVALEWRPSLQAKMLRLQRKHARGSICV